MGGFANADIHAADSGRAPGAFVVGWRIQRVAKVAGQLGSCKPGRVDMIRGGTGPAFPAAA